MASFSVGTPIITSTPTIAVDAGLPTGSHRFQLEVIDSAGNRSKPDIAIVTVQKLVISVPPAGPIPGPTIPQPGPIVPPALPTLTPATTLTPSPTLTSNPTLTPSPALSPNTVAPKGITRSSPAPKRRTKRSDPK